MSLSERSEDKANTARQGREIFSLEKILLTDSSTPYKNNKINTKYLVTDSLTIIYLARNGSVQLWIKQCIKCIN